MKNCDSERQWICLSRHSYINDQLTGLRTASGRCATCCVSMSVAQPCHVSMCHRKPCIWWPELNPAMPAWLKPSRHLCFPMFANTGMMLTLGVDNTSLITSSPLLPCTSAAAAQRQTYHVGALQLEVYDACAACQVHGCHVVTPDHHSLQVGAVCHL